LILAGLAVALAACAVLSSPPTRNLYQVTPATGFPAGLPHLTVQLRVDTPTAAPGLDTNRIALSHTPVSLDYFADSIWADRVPEMVRTALVETFENSGAVDAVGSGAFGLNADFELKPEVREFTAIYDSAAGANGPPTVAVTLALKLIKMPERTIAAQTLLTDRQVAAANEIQAIVVAFNTALGKAMKQAVVWTVTNPALSQKRRQLSLSRFVHGGRQRDVWRPDGGILRRHR
jgi:cholesterol transport system auxiliary component